MASTTTPINRVFIPRSLRPYLAKVQVVGLGLRGFDFDFLTLKTELSTPSRIYIFNPVFKPVFSASGGRVSRGFQRPMGDKMAVKGDKMAVKRGQNGS